MSNPLQSDICKAAFLILMQGQEGSKRTQRLVLSLSDDAGSLLLSAVTETLTSCFGSGRTKRQLQKRHL